MKTNTLKTSIPGLKIEFTLQFDSGSNQLTKLQNYIQSFIQKYNDTWDTNFTYNDIIHHKDEQKFFKKLIDYLNDGISGIIEETVEDEFFNGLNHELTKLKNQKELNL